MGNYNLSFKSITNAIYFIDLAKEFITFDANLFARHFFSLLKRGVIMEVGPTGGGGSTHAAAQAKPVNSPPAELENKETNVAKTIETQATASTNPSVGQNINLVA